VEQDRGEPMAKEKDEIEENTYGPGKYEDLIGIKGYKVKGQVVTYIFLLNILFPSKCCSKTI
jgi:hypothetical protein